jgi:hypothetical protein
MALHRKSKEEKQGEKNGKGKRTRFQNFELAGATQKGRSN